MTAEEAFILYCPKEGAGRQRSRAGKVTGNPGVPARAGSRSRCCGRNKHSSRDRFARQSQSCHSAVKDGSQTICLPASHPNEARAVACTTRTRAARRPASQYDSAGDHHLLRHGRLEKSNGPNGGEPSVGGIRLRCNYYEIDATKVSITHRAVSLRAKRKRQIASQNAADG